MIPMIGMPGQAEILILLVIVLVVFGPKNLPRLARAMGQSVRELKDGLSGVGDDMKEAASKPAGRDSAKPAPANTVEHEPKDIDQD